MMKTSGGGSSESESDGEAHGNNNNKRDKGRTINLGTISTVRSSIGNIKTMRKR